MNDEKHMDRRAIQHDPEWAKARPGQLPKPTYWPFFLAMGLAFLFWGMLTTWVIGLAGFLIFTIALIGWINLLRHDKE